MNTQTIFVAPRVAWEGMATAQYPPVKALLIPQPQPHFQKHVSKYFFLTYFSLTMAVIWLYNICNFQPLFELYETYKRVGTWIERGEIMALSQREQTELIMLYHAFVRQVSWLIGSIVTVWCAAALAFALRLFHPGNPASEKIFKCVFYFAIVFQMSHTVFLFPHVFVLFGMSGHNLISFQLEGLRLFRAWDKGLSNFSLLALSGDVEKNPGPAYKTHVVHTGNELKLRNLDKAAFAIVAYNRPQNHHDLETRALLVAEMVRCVLDDLPNEHLAKRYSNRLHEYVTYLSSRGYPPNLTFHEQFILQHMAECVNLQQSPWKFVKNFDDYLGLMLARSGDVEKNPGPLKEISQVRKEMEANLNVIKFLREEQERRALDLSEAINVVFEGVLQLIVDCTGAKFDGSFVRAQAGDIEENPGPWEVSTEHPLTVHQRIKEMMLWEIDDLAVGDPMRAVLLREYRWHCSSSPSLVPPPPSTPEPLPMVQDAFGLFEREPGFSPPKQKRRKAQILPPSEPSGCWWGDKFDYTVRHSPNDLQQLRWIVRRWERELARSDDFHLRRKLFDADEMGVGDAMSIANEFSMLYTEYEGQKWKKAFDQCVFELKYICCTCGRCATCSIPRVQMNVFDSFANTISSKFVSQLKGPLSELSEVKTQVQEAIRKVGNTAETAEQLMFLGKLVLILCAGIYCIRTARTGDVVDNVMTALGVLGIFSASYKLGAFDDFTSRMSELRGRPEVQAFGPTKGVWHVLAVAFGSLFCVTPAAFRTEKFYTSLPQYFRVGDAASDMIEPALNAAQAVFNYVTHDCLGYGPTRFVDSGHIKLEKWYRDVVKTIMIKENDRQLRTDLMTLADEGRALDVDISALERPRLAGIVKDGMKLLDERMKAGFLDFMPSEAVQLARPVPVAVYVSGESAIGKSTLTSMFMTEFCARVISPFRHEEMRIGNDLIFAKPKSSEYWEGYINQPVILFPDFGQVRSTPGQVGADEVAFIDLKSSERFPCNFADLPKKGKIHAKPKMLFCTGNSAVVKPEVIQHKVALWRRFDICVEARVKKEFRRQTADGRWVPDPAKTKGINFAIYNFHVYDMAKDGAMTGEILSWEQMMNRTVDCYWKYVDEYYQTTSAINMKLNGLFRKKAQVQMATDDLAALVHKLHPLVAQGVERYITEHNIPEVVPYLLDTVVPHESGETLDQFHQKQEESIYVDMIDLAPQALQDRAAKYATTIADERSLVMARGDSRKETIWSFVKFGSMALGLMLGLYSATKMFFSKKEEGVAQANYDHKEGTKYNLKNKLPAHLKADVAQVQLDAAMTQMSTYHIQDPNGVQSLHKVMAKNHFSLFLEAVDGTYTSRIIRVLGLRDNIFLCNYHLKDGLTRFLEEKGQDEILVKGRYHEVKVMTKEIIDSMVPIAGTGDMATFTLQAFANRAHPNCVDQFILEKFTKFGAHSLAMLWDPGMLANDGLGFYKMTEAKTESFAREFGSAYNKQIMTHRRIIYNLLTYDSNCGAPVTLLNPHIVPGKLVGLHGAGMNPMLDLKATTVGMCEVVTCEMLKEHLKQTRAVVQAPTIEQLREMGFEVAEKLNNRVGAPAFSKLRKSKLYNPEHVKTAPARLKEFVNEDGVKIDPITEAIKKYAPTPSKLPLDWFSQAMATVVSWTVHESPRMLTYREAVEGNPQLGIDALDRSTSCGYPMNQQKGCDGKKHIFGSCGSFDFDSPMARAVEDEVHRVLEILNDPTVSKDSKARLFVFQDNLKDERRPYLKVVNGQTRLFNAAPLVFVIVCRMLYGSFFGQMLQQRIANGSAVGINPTSPEWGDLKEYLCPNSDWMPFDGDHAKFDASQDGDGIECVFTHVRATYNDTFDCARESVSYVYAHSFHIVSDILYQWVGRLPSGVPFTAWVNVCYGLALLVTIWNIRTAEEDCPDLDMHKYFRPCQFGDDSLGGANKVGRKIMSGEAMRFWMEKFGHGFTNSSKTGPPEYTTWDNVTFLKRSFVWSEEFSQWLAPLNVDVIKEIPCWYRQGLEAEMIKRTNVDVSLLEMCLHGKKAFNEWYAYIRPLSVEAYQYNPRYSTWEQAIRSVLVLKHPQMALFMEPTPSPEPVAMVQMADNANIAQKTDHMSKVDGANSESCAEGSSEMHSTTDMVSADCVAELLPLAESSRMALRGTPDSNRQSIMDFLGKPHVIDTFSWTTASASNTDLSTKSPIQILLTDTMIANKLDGVLGLRADLVLETQVNMSNFNVGMAMTLVEPGWDHTRYSAGATSLYTLTQLPHVIINGGTMSRTKMTVPFYHNCEWFQLAPGTSVNAGASWWYMRSHFVVLSPQLAPSAETSCQVTLYGWFENIELIGASGSNVWQQQAGNPKVKDKREELEKPSAVVRTIAGAVNTLARIPIIGNAAVTVGWAGEALANAMQAFGFSNPRNESSATTIRPDNWGDSTNADGVDNSTPLSISIRNRVGRVPTVSYTALDEISFDFILGKWSWIGNFSFADSATSGTLLWSLVNSPGSTSYRGTSTVGGVTRVYPHPLNMMSRMFVYFRGDLEIKFHFVKNQFHKFRVIYAVFPRTTGSPAATTITDTNYVNRVVFDGADADELTVDLPYLSEKPVIRTDLQTTWAGLIVQSPLRAPPSTAQTIDVVVTCRVKPGSVWFGLSDWFSNANSFIAPAVVQMGSPDTMKDKVPVGAIGNAGHEYITEFVGGENPRSFRQLIKMLDRFVTSAQSGTSDWMGAHGSGYLIAHDFESAYLSSSVISPGRGTSSRMNIIAAMFGNYTGSMVLEFSSAGCTDMEVGLSGPTSTWVSPYGPDSTLVWNTAKAPLKLGSYYVNNNVKFTVPFNSQFLCQPVIFNYNASSSGYTATRSAGTPATAGNEVWAVFVHVSQGTTVNYLTSPAVFRRAADDFGFSWFLGMPPYVVATNTGGSTQIDVLNSFVTTN